jgi:hypothetical protein
MNIFQDFFLQMYVLIIPTLRNINENNMCWIILTVIGRHNLIFFDKLFLTPSSPKTSTQNSFSFAHNLQINCASHTAISSNFFSERCNSNASHRHSRYHYQRSYIVTTMDTAAVIVTEWESTVTRVNYKLHKPDYTQTVVEILE